MSRRKPVELPPVVIHADMPCKSGQPYVAADGSCLRCGADQGVQGCACGETFEDRLKPALLRSLIGFWSDVDEVRQRAGINAGASPAAWRALNGLVADGLVECSGSDLQYRLTDAGRVALSGSKE